MEQQPEPPHLEDFVKESKQKEEKIYLTEQEVASIQQINQMQQSIFQTKVNLSDKETAITTLSDECLKIKRELPDLEKDFKIQNFELFNDLKNKYGNFKLGENNEVIKVGE